MSTIAIRVTEEQFNAHILPHLSTAKRGFVCQIPLYKVFNYILDRLPMATVAHCPAPERRDKKEISWQAVYYHFRK